MMCLVCWQNRCKVLVKSGLTWQTHKTLALSSPVTLISFWLAPELYHLWVVPVKAIINPFPRETPKNVRKLSQLPTWDKRVVRMNTTKTIPTTKNSRKILNENNKKRGKITRNDKYHEVKTQKIQHNRNLRNWKTETKIKGNLDLQNKREHQIPSKTNKRPISHFCVRQSVKCVRERKNTVTKTKEKKKTWPTSRKEKPFSVLPCTIFVTLHECYTCPLFWHSRLKYIFR